MWARLVKSKLVCWGTWDTHSMTVWNSPVLGFPASVTVMLSMCSECEEEIIRENPGMWAMPQLPQHSTGHVKQEIGGQDQEVRHTQYGESTVMGRPFGWLGTSSQPGKIHWYTATVQHHTTMFYQVVALDTPFMLVSMVLPTLIPIQWPYHAVCSSGKSM